MYRFYQKRFRAFLKRPPEGEGGGVPAGGWEKESSLVALHSSSVLINDPPFGEKKFFNF